MTSDLSLMAAFIGGFVSFFSPCILPIIPGYLSFIAGGEGTTSLKVGRWRIFWSTMFFVIGFSVVFTLLGLFLGTISGVFVNFSQWLNWVGGTLIIVFGLFTLKLISIPFLNQDHRLQSPQTLSKGFLGSFSAGAIFAIAWSPCVSAILASILVLAVTTGSKAQGAILLLSFSVGLGIPFLLTGAFIEKTRKFIKISGPVLKYINLISGILLLILGILVFTNKLIVLINIFS